MVDHARINYLLTGLKLISWCSVNHFQSTNIDNHLVGLTDNVRLLRIVIIL